MNSRCSKCGTGKNKDGTFTLPKDWPINDKCKECEKRSRIRMFKLGQSWRKEQDNRILKTLVSGTI